MNEFGKKIPESATGFEYSPTIKLLAKSVAREMIAASDRGTREVKMGNAKFFVSRDQKSVVGNLALEVEGETFYVGIATTET